MTEETSDYCSSSGVSHHLLEQCRAIITNKHWKDFFSIFILLQHKIPFSDVSSALSDDIIRISMMLTVKCQYYWLDTNDWGWEEGNGCYQQLHTLVIGLLIISVHHREGFNTW